MATTKKTSTKTSTKTTTTKKAAGKAVAAEQMTLVDALSVAAPRATRAAAPQVPEAQTFVLVDDKPPRAGDWG